MKVRTFLLFACMVVVPGLAMFSHRVPAEVRSATRCALWDPIQDWAAGWSKPDSVASPEQQEDDGGNIAPANPGSGTTQTQDRFAVGAGLGAADQPRGTAGLTAADPSGRLAALGVSMVDCRPLDAQMGSHVASCRVPIDASGQLHRVFQAAGGTPQEAVSSLADQVEQWQHRLASRASAAEPSSGTAAF